MERNNRVVFGLILLFLYDTGCGLNGESVTVTLEAYESGGFSAWIPATNYSTFHFHARLNDQISQYDPGIYFGEITYPVDGKYIFSYPNVTLKKGDVINYWFMAIRSGLGYRGTGSWTVEDLKPRSSCVDSTTFFSGKEGACRGSLIFQDDFSEINKEKWLVNHYIPFYDEDYEFVSYENEDDVCFVKESNLVIKPTKRNNVRGELDMREGCTRNTEPECYSKYNGPFILPPVRSAKVYSAFEITFAKIEIKAKLPAGDWIYPELYLQSTTDPSRKIFIAYARGNEKLTDPRGNELGGKLLYGGPAFSYKEPQRSRYLRTKLSSVPFSSSTHTYGVVWTPVQMELSVDGEIYGEVTNHHFTDKAKLVLGVGVGGVNDFADDYLSNGIKKPWINEDRLQMKDFLNASDIWSSTWTGDNVALQIDSISIWAV